MKRYGFFLRKDDKNIFIEHTNSYLRDSTARSLMLRLNLLDISADGIQNFKNTLTRAILVQSEGGINKLIIRKMPTQEVPDITIINTGSGGGSHE